MISFPEAQLKVQEELDCVLQGWLPEYDNLKDLPYITALVKEILWWERGLTILTNAIDDLLIQS